MRRIALYLLIWSVILAAVVWSWRHRADEGSDTAVALPVASPRAPAERAVPRMVPGPARLAPWPGEDAGEVPSVAFPASAPPADAGDGSRAERARIAGEHVLRFYDAQDARRFAEAAERSGATVLGFIPGANLLRIRVRDEAHWRRLQEQGPLVLESSPNHRTWSPERRAPPAPPEGVDYRAFGAAAPAWLGLDSPWLPGEGKVVVAMLDDGVVPHWAYRDMALREVDLVGGESGAGLSAHGSAMASLLAGHTPAVPGVAAGVELLSYRVLQPDGSGDAFTLAEAIIAAVDAGARVINCSLGTHGDNLALREAVAYAYSHRVTIVAAAGNDGLADRLVYPAQYATTLAVAAVDAEGRQAWFSNAGEAVDVAAPGYGINAAWTNGTVARISGTSPAAALVSGAAARLLSEHPALGPDDVRAILQSTSDDYGEPGADPALGSGIVNLARMERRDEPGLYELSVRPPHLRYGTEFPDRLTGVFFAQNTGTETAAQVELSVTLNGSVQRFTYYQVPPGELVIRTLALGSRTTRPQQVSIVFEAAIRGRPHAVSRLEAALTIPALVSP